MLRWPQGPAPDGYAWSAHPPGQCEGLPHASPRPRSSCACTRRRCTHRPSATASLWRTVTGSARCHTGDRQPPLRVTTGPRGVSVRMAGPPATRAKGVDTASERHAMCQGGCPRGATYLAEAASTAGATIIGHRDRLGAAQGLLDAPVAGHGCLAAHRVDTGPVGRGGLPRLVHRAPRSAPRQSTGPASPARLSPGDAQRAPGRLARGAAGQVRHRAAALQRGATAQPPRPGAAPDVPAEADTSRAVSLYRVYLPGTLTQPFVPFGHGVVL